jgi:hypothetical protein
MNEQVRAYIYRVAAAVVPLLVLLGVVTQEIAMGVLVILGAALMIGEGGLVLAAKNTSTSASNQ